LVLGRYILMSVGLLALCYTVIVEVVYLSAAAAITNIRLLLLFLRYKLLSPQPHNIPIYRIRQI